MIRLRKPAACSFGIAGIALVFATQAVIGITWGLPSRSIDKYLFPDGDVWSGEKIYRLANAGGKFDASRGADVDADPLAEAGDAPIPLTATEGDVAKILLRYRLYTHQPDEMITMMALAGMKPGRLELDPKLYQYGGLFIYPVGALIKLCGMLGLIDVRSDVVYYLDNPDEFGKFYVVARAYAAAWGMIGVFVVYAIARRVGRFRTANLDEWSEHQPAASAPGSENAPPPRGGATFDISHRIGLLAALLFALLPVVVCMSHEGKPHLPGAVLMLIAVYLAMRCSDDERTVQPFWWMCVACGAAVGMVLSSWPICVLIVLVAIRAVGASPRSSAVRVLAGGAVAIGVYLLANPYVLINALTNREVLRSNFGNSLAMYNVARIGDGFLRVIELTAEGATWAVLVLGVVGLVAALHRGSRAAVPLIVVATVFFLQFVLIGAGKPAEYGRFGVFTNTALAIGLAVLFGKSSTSAEAMPRSFAAILVVSWVGLAGGGYLNNFRIDASDFNSRTEFAKLLPTWSGNPLVIAVRNDPAPYNCPPYGFSRIRTEKAVPASTRSAGDDRRGWLVVPYDGSNPFRSFGRRLGCGGPLRANGGTWWDTPISWANKPLMRLPYRSPP